MALGAAGVRAGDEVIVPSYSFVATPLAVLQVGAVPVFVDLYARARRCSDASAIEAAVTPPYARRSARAHARLRSHDMKAILKLRGAEAWRRRRRRGGGRATYGGRPVGALGDAGGFSLESSKNLAAGEGGLCHERPRHRRGGRRDPTLVKTCRSPTRSAPAGSRRPSMAVGPRLAPDGSMYAVNEMMAAFARAQLVLPERTARCQHNAARLSRALCRAPRGDTSFLPVPGRTSVHHKFRFNSTRSRRGGPRAGPPPGCHPAALSSPKGSRSSSGKVSPARADRVSATRRLPRLSRSIEGGTDLALNYSIRRAYPRTRRCSTARLWSFRNLPAYCTVRRADHRDVRRSSAVGIEACSPSARKAAQRPGDGDS